MKKIVIVVASCALVGILAMAGCAPQARDDTGDAVEDTASSLSVQTTWSAESDCAVCHASEEKSYDDQACLASQHRDRTCIECHADEGALAGVHEDKTAEDKKPKRLKKTEVSEGSCLTCHYGSREELAEATPDLLLTDYNGTSANPHNLPACADHEALTCVDCHGMHVEQPILEQAQETCTGCHHAGVFECYTCHE